MVVVAWKVVYVLVVESVNSARAVAVLSDSVFLLEMNQLNNSIDQYNIHVHYPVE